MIQQTLLNLFKYFAIERPVRNKSLSQLASRMEETQESFLARWEDLDGNENDRKWLSHVIGIERWIQSRLKVTLGDPYNSEEYDRYRPDLDTPWIEMRGQMAATREESIRIAQQLVEENIAAEDTVTHNQFGDLTVRGWLRYLTFHADAGRRAHGRL